MKLTGKKPLRIFSRGRYIHLIIYNGYLVKVYTKNLRELYILEIAYLFIGINIVKFVLKNFAQKYF